MASLTAYFKDNTMVVELVDVQDAAGTVQTSGSGTATLYALDETVIGSAVAFAHIAAGLWRAILPSSLAVILGGEYYVDAVLDCSSQRGHWRERVKAQYRSL